MDFGDENFLIAAKDDLIFNVRSVDEIIKVANLPKMVSLTDLLDGINQFAELAKNEQNIDLVMGTYHMYRSVIASAVRVGIDVNNFQALLDRGASKMGLI